VGRRSCDKKLRTSCPLLALEFGFHVVVAGKIAGILVVTDVDSNEDVS